MVVGLVDVVVGRVEVLELVECEVDEEVVEWEEDEDEVECDEDEETDEEPLGATKVEPSGPYLMLL